MKAEAIWVTAEDRKGESIMKVQALLAALILATGLILCSPALGSGPQQGMTLDTAAMEHTEETATKILRTEQIREMQTLLKDRGYEVGEVNGQINPETTRALEEFQKDRGLAVTGTPTRETLRALSLSSAQQEFFGLSPQFGEMEDMPAHKKIEGQGAY